MKFNHWKIHPIDMLHTLSYSTATFSQNVNTCKSSHKVLSLKYSHLNLPHEMSF